VDIGQYKVESSTGNQINGTASRDNVAHPIQYLVFRGTGRTDGVVVNGPHQRRTLFGSQNGEDTCTASHVQHFSSFKGCVKHVTHHQRSGLVMPGTKGHF